MTATNTTSIVPTWLNPVATAMREALVDRGYSLPVSQQHGEIGEIVDAEGRNILQVDPLGVREDEDVAAIAGLISYAINLACGFKAKNGALPPVEYVDLLNGSVTLSAELDAMVSDWKARADQDNRHA